MTSGFNVDSVGGRILFAIFSFAVFAILFVTIKKARNQRFEEGDE